MTTFAVIRPDDWNFPLFLHVLGALLLVGALILSASVLLLAARGGDAAQLRLGYRSLLLGVLPAWILMRISAQWIADKEGLEDAEVTWLDIGWSTGDGGLLFILIAVLLAYLARRRAGDARAGGLATGAGVFAALLLIAYLVTLWAMSAKPT